MLQLSKKYVFLLGQNVKLRHGAFAAAAAVPPQSWPDASDLAEKQAEESSHGYSKTRAETPVSTPVQHEQQDSFDQSMAMYGVQMSSNFALNPQDPHQWANPPPHILMNDAFQPEDLNIVQPNNFPKQRVMIPEICHYCGSAPEMASVSPASKVSAPKAGSGSRHEDIHQARRTKTHHHPSSKAWPDDPRFFGSNAGNGKMSGNTSVPSRAVEGNSPAESERSSITSLASASPRAGTSEVWTTMLHISAKAGHATIIKLLLEGGADVNELDSGGATVLHHMARTGNEDIVRLLLRYNADRSVVDQAGWAASHCAAESGSEAVLSLLLSPKNG